MKKAEVYGLDYKRLNKALQQHRDAGETIVMCSGTFDLFHLGHMRLLAAAKEKGDILVVAVKSDRAASLKKTDPPVLNQVVRMETVSNCISADYVIMADFDPRRPLELAFDNVSSFQWLNMFEPAVKAVRPHIFVHEPNPVIANARAVLFEKYNVAGLVQPRTDGISTTEIIDLIRTRLLKELQ